MSEGEVYALRHEIQAFSAIGVRLTVGSDNENSTRSVLQAFACTKEKGAANQISKWLKKGKEPALLDVDASLGWPRTLSRVLATHRAGEELRAGPHDMFRLATDIFIKQKTGKTPLDVGADRIARTAHAALCLLRDTRTRLNLERIRLAWEWPSAELISSLTRRSHEVSTTAR